MGSSQRIVKGVIWTTILNIVNAIYGFISIPILINHFGKAEYGLIGLAMSINIYLQLMDMGFNSTNIRFFSTWLAEGKCEKVQKAFQTNMSFYSIIGLVNAIILIVISLFAQDIFNVTTEQNIILKHLLYILSVSAFCSWISGCFDQIIRATENVAWIQIRTLITKMLMIVVLIATIKLHLSIELYYALTCLSTLSIIPMSINKIRKDISCINFLPKIDKTVLKEILPYSLNIFSFSFFQFSFHNLRTVFLGIKGTMESITDYRILNSIIGIVVMLGGAFISILLPSTAKIVAQSNRNAFYRIAYSGTKYISILISFCCFGMMSIGREVLILYVGDTYLYLTVWFNIWLLCTLGTHNQAISSLILSGKDIRAISYNSIFSSIIGLLICWILIPYYQIGGTVIAYIVYTLSQLLFFYLYYWPKKMKINSWKVFTEDFIPYVILGTTIYLCLQFLPNSSKTIVTLLVKGGLFSICYLFGLLLLTNKEDKTFFVSIIHRSNKSQQ